MCAVVVSAVTIMWCSTPHHCHLSGSRQHQENIDLVFGVLQRCGQSLASLKDAKDTKDVTYQRPLRSLLSREQNLSKTF
jgi:hypothetical protein